MAIHTGQSVISALLRHFIDLRHGRHGADAVTRLKKETLFAAAARLLEPYARQVLEELNDGLMLAAEPSTAPVWSSSTRAASRSLGRCRGRSSGPRGSGRSPWKRSTASVSTIHTCTAPQADPASARQCDHGFSLEVAQVGADRPTPVHGCGHGLVIMKLSTLRHRQEYPCPPYHHG
jgi:hypothetical protein